MTGQLLIVFLVAGNAQAVALGEKVHASVVFDTVFFGNESKWMKQVIQIRVCLCVCLVDDEIEACAFDRIS